MTTIIDAQARAQAIDPNGSYIVQAPAGSGKTELLIQRILALLATVSEPEEVLALTFTKKAAAEMRERVIKALFAAQRAQPSEPHALATWKLAHKVLQHSETMGWRLSEYPARLRIMTLDAFASGLARQLPVLSGFGQTPATADFAEPMYQQAVSDLMAYAEQKQAPKALQQAIHTLILHQDCKINRLQDLLASMLARREQWLPDVLKYSQDMGSLRQHLEASLSAIIEHTMQQASAQFSLGQKDELVRLANFATAQLSLNQGDAEHALQPFLSLTTFPDATPDNIAAFKSLAHLLMTAGYKVNIRKSVTKTLGFDTSDASKPFKQDMLALLAQLQGNPELVQTLIAVRGLPESANFSDSAWQTLEALFLVLKMLAVHLWQSFEQHKQVDFIEIMLRAKQALGAEDGQGNIIPSDALLRLDHQIKHILVDEFQDTSTLQIDLLSRLTAGWSQDGRTIFMVGDPMQSIYRFRKAEVSLFLKAADNALPTNQQLPKVHSLKLHQNFRSSPEIITWVNQMFTHLLPQTDDVLSGAIAYTASTAFKQDKGLVRLNILAEKSEAQEAELMLDVIKKNKAQGKRIGVLARSRNHLHALMQTLQAENIPFRALDVLPLNKQPEVMDLFNLTKALLYPADHIAWASVLRSPILGLKKNTLFDILHDQPLSLWDNIKSYAQTNTDIDEQKILKRFIHAFEAALPKVRRLHLHKLVESTWLQLQAPASLSKTQLMNADMFFKLLQQWEDTTAMDISWLEKRLQKLYAKPEAKLHAEQVELLTMHGAKGLQWDTVILCGLGKTPRAKDKDVLVQTETNTHLGKQLLLSPLPQHGQDQTYDLIRNFEKQRDELEVARLLYVACTRAERELHMFGEVRGENKAPASSSLLARLLQDDESCFDADVVWHEPKQQQTENQPTIITQRLPPHIQSLTPFAAIQPQQQKDILLTTPLKPEFSWASAQAKAVGIALHAALQQIATLGLSQWKEANNDELTALMTHILHREGLSKNHLDKALKRCQQGLDKCFTSKRLQWVLSEDHHDQHSEWALTYTENDVCKHVILDYTFIDEQGTRWIVDYKTGSHFDDVETFLDQELHRYTVDTPQLPNYVKAMQALEPERNIKAALYFPMLDGWREWQAVVS